MTFTLVLFDRPKREIFKTRQKSKATDSEI